MEESFINWFKNNSEIKEPHRQSSQPVASFSAEVLQREETVKNPFFNKSLFQEKKSPPKSVKVIYL